MGREFIGENYKKILEELTKTCSHIESFSQVRQPKLSNLELAALNLTAEYMSYNIELQLFIVVKNTELDGKIERSNYNKRRRKLKSYTEQVRQCRCISGLLRHFMARNDARRG
jgi:galactokinase